MHLKLLTKWNSYGYLRKQTTVFKIDRIDDSGNLKMESSKISTITQKVALEIDSILMEKLGYSLLQLMELAGLSASLAINDMYKGLDCKNRNVLVCSGPGNNGGDGLVISRHLSEFGFKIALFYPKIGQKDIYKSLLLLLDSYNVEILNELPSDLSEYGIIVDALFGISFKPPLRKPFDTIIENIANAKVPVISIDVPSGWNVDEGSAGSSLKPYGLVSLGIPKRCSRDFKGVHYLAGRFIPRSVLESFGVILDEYQDSQLFISHVNSGLIN